MHLPFADVPISADLASKLGGKNLVIVGIRPEHFEDVNLLEESKVSSGVTFTAPVDVSEWLGSELYAYIPFETNPDVATDARGARPRPRRRGPAHPAHRHARVRDEGPRRRRRRTSGSTPPA